MKLETLNMKPRRFRASGLQVIEDSEPAVLSVRTERGPQPFTMPRPVLCLAVSADAAVFIAERLSSPIIHHSEL